MDTKTINIILFLASKIKNLYVTKLLKLIYLIDEKSVADTGTQATSLNYKVWKHGPVNVDLYNELTFDDYGKLSNYVNFEYNKYGKIVENKKDCNFDEFSEYELKMFDKIVAKYGKMSSLQLVKLLHKKNSLWYKIVKEKGLDKQFKYSENSTSPYEIDFKEKIKNDNFKSFMYDFIKETELI